MGVSTLRDETREGKSAGSKDAAYMFEKDKNHMQRDVKRIHFKIFI